MTDKSVGLYILRPIVCVLIDAPQGRRVWIADDHESPVVRYALVHSHFLGIDDNYRHKSNEIVDGLTCRGRDLSLTDPSTEVKELLSGCWMCEQELLCYWPF